MYEDNVLYSFQVVLFVIEVDRRVLGCRTNLILNYYYTNLILNTQGGRGVFRWEGGIGVDALPPPPPPKKEGRYYEKIKRC